MSTIKEKDFFIWLTEIENYKEIQNTKLINYFDDNKIEYCIIGSKALPVHNYEKRTGNIDFLIDENDYKKVKNYLIKNDYIESDNKWFTIINNDIQYNICLILSGIKCNELFIYPKPAEVKEKIEGTYYINLKELIKYKILYGYSWNRRMGEWNDVVELIQANKLKKDYYKGEKNEKLKLAYDLLHNKDYKKIFRMEGY